jgi:hypothetical protein
MPDYFAVYPDQTGRLEDYKAGRLKLKTHQLPVYGWLCNLHYGTTEIHAAKYYLRDSTMGSQMVLKENDFNAAGKWVWNGVNTIRSMLDKGEKGFRQSRTIYANTVRYQLTARTSTELEHLVKLTILIPGAGEDRKQFKGPGCPLFSTKPL